MLKRFLTLTEAEFAEGYLKQNGFETQIIGAKEYSGIVTGKDYGNYELMISEENFEVASDLLRRIEIHEVSETDDNELQKTKPKSHLKRAVLFAVMAIFILPIFFNVVSLMNLRHYLQKEKSSSRFAWLLFVLLLNLGSIIAILIFLKIWGWQYIRNLQ